MRLTLLLLFALLLSSCAGFTATALDLGATAGRTFAEGESASSNYVGIKANIHYERR